MADEVATAYKKFVEKALEPLGDEVRHCQNCAYSTGRLGDFGKCMRTGRYIEIQRGYHRDEADCDREFSGWKAIPTPKAWWRFWK